MFNWLFRKPETRTCSMCEQSKQVTEFWKSTRNGYQGHCKGCTNLYKRRRNALKSINKSLKTGFVQYVESKESK